MRSNSWWSLVSLVTLVACSGSPEPAPAEPPAPVAAETPELGDQDPALLAAQADRKYALVPSPVETEAALAKAGIDGKLGGLITVRAWKLDEKDTERVAVRTGVILADTLLTLKTAKDEEVIAHLEELRQGMTTLKGGEDVDKTLVDIITRVKAGAVTREELLKEFDQLAGAVIPELEFNGVSRVVPLVQAGSWLEAANLVAKAAKGNAASVSDILKQPDVVGYFAEFSKQRDPSTPAPVGAVLDTTLASLTAISTKTEPLTDADLDAITQAAEAVLVLL
jgi:hypothetical protein